MGFFESFGGSIIGGIVSGAFSYIGEKVSGVVHSMITKVKTFVKSSFEKPRIEYDNVIEASSTEISSTDSYDEDDSDITDISSTIDINDELARFAYSVEHLADEMENSCLTMATGYISEITNTIFSNERNGDSHNISETRIKQFSKELEVSIRGTLKSFIAKRVTLDNFECLQIMTLPSGLEKSEKLKHFQKEALNDGLNVLTGKIRAIVNTQQKQLINHINENIESINLSVSNTINDISELYETMDKGMKDSLIKSKYYQDDINMCKEILSLVNDM